jgi:hypothetical protein
MRSVWRSEKSKPDILGGWKGGFSPCVPRESDGPYRAGGNSPLSGINASRVNMEGRPALRRQQATGTRKANGGQVSAKRRVSNCGVVKQGASRIEVKPSENLEQSPHLGFGQGS